MFNETLSEIDAIIDAASISRDAGKQRDHSVELDARQEVSTRLRFLADWLDEDGWLPNAVIIAQRRRPDQLDFF